MSIFNLNPGQRGIITGINGNSKLTKRLSALGCIEGTQIKFKRKAPLGDPVIVNFRGFDLAIRKKDAECIILENIG
ncbi:MAG: ferrous iron transport protein A [Clostridium butyricum]|jgi:ferrous iron transport protein A|nr:ferrous iron transport protein A [Clostridium butyricum]